MRYLQTQLLLILVLPIYSQSVTRLTNFAPDSFEAISTSTAAILTGKDGNIYFVTNFEFNRKLHFSDGTIEGTGLAPNVLFEYDSVTESVYSEDYIYFCMNTDQTSHYSISQFSRHENIELAWDGFTQGAHSITTVGNDLYFLDFDNKLYRFIDKDSELLFEEGNVRELIGFKNALYFTYEIIIQGSKSEYFLAKYELETDSVHILRKTTEDRYVNSFLKVVDNNLIFGIEDQNELYQAWMFNDTTGELKEIPYSFPEGLYRSINNIGFAFKPYTPFGSSKLYSYDFLSEESSEINIGKPLGSTLYSKQNELDGKLYFLSRQVGSNSDDRYIYVSDLTIEGTHQLNVQNSEFGGDTDDGYSMCIHDGNIYHTPLSNKGRELWKIDPTNYHVDLVKDINPGWQKSSNPIKLFSSGENLYFFAETDQHGYQLYVYNDNAVSTNTELPFSPMNRVGPNPVRSNLNIEFDSKTMAPQTISLSNNLGEKILFRKLDQATNRSIELDLQDFGAGIYFLSIEYETITQVYKIIKM